MASSLPGTIRTPRPPFPLTAGGVRGRSAGWPLALGTAGGATAALTLWGPSAARLNPYYDAAVRSMGTSLRAFATAAFDPSMRVAIDKPPLAAWLQVLSTGLFGRHPLALLLPAALAGAVAVPLLGLVVARAAGRAAGLVAALALMVLPVAVLTARSDTPDALLALGLIAAAGCLLRGLDAGGPRWFAAAGVALGLAFEAKGTEALLPLPAFALTLVVARARVTSVGLFAAVAAVTGLAWPVAVTLLPGHHPWPVGSSDGTVWSVLLTSGGVDRLGAASPGLHTAMVPPAALRLLTRGGADLLRLIGVEAAAAVLAGIAVVTLNGRRRPAAATVLFGGWLVTGLLLFSAMPRLHVRYLDAVAPAVAALLGLGVAALARAGARPIAALLAVAALAPCAVAALQIAGSQATDGGTPGALPATELAHLSGFLRARQTGRYEVAGATPDVSAPLLAGDGRPVLVLSTGMGGHAVVSPAALRAAVRTGAVRYVYLGSSCAHGSGRCPAAARWARRAGADATRAAGLPGRGRLVDLRGAVS